MQVMKREKGGNAHLPGGRRHQSRHPVVTVDQVWFDTWDDILNYFPLECQRRPSDLRIGNRRTRSADRKTPYLGRGGAAGNVLRHRADTLTGYGGRATCTSAPHSESQSTSKAQTSANPPALTQGACLPFFDRKSLALSSGVMMRIRGRRLWNSVRMCLEAHVGGSRWRTSEMEMMDMEQQSIMGGECWSFVCQGKGWQKSFNLR